MLSIDSLRVTYGGAVEAVRGVTMEVPDGKVVAVLGSNGAGKSTLLRTISGTLRLHRGRVDEGSVSFDGDVLTSRDPGQIVRQGVVQVGDGHVVATVGASDGCLLLRGQRVVPALVVGQQLWSRRGQPDP